MVLDASSWSPKRRCFLVVYVPLVCATPASPVYEGTQTPDAMSPPPTVYPVTAADPSYRLWSGTATFLYALRCISKKTKVQIVCLSWSAPLLG